MLDCRHCHKEIKRDLSGDFIHANTNRALCYINGDVTAEPSTDTWEGFNAVYIEGTGRATVIDMEEPREHSPFVVVKYGRYRMVLNPMGLTDHLCVDVHSFVDDKDARAGVFGMDDGFRVSFPDDQVKGTSYGWPAASLITVLLGEQKEVQA